MTPTIRFSLGALCAVVVYASAADPGCIEKGRAAFDAKNWKEAARTLEKCGDDPAAWPMLGLAYFELSYMEDAKTWLMIFFAACNIVLMAPTVIIAHAPWFTRTKAGDR